MYEHIESINEAYSLLLCNAALYTLTHLHVTTAFTKRYYSFASATLTYA